MKFEIEEDNSFLKKYFQFAVFICLARKNN